MLKPRSKASLVLSFTLAFGFCTIATAEDLAMIVEKACTFHPQIRSADLSVMEAMARVKETRSVILPQIDSVTEFGLTEDFDKISTAQDNGRPLSTRLSLNQPLYLGGRGRAAIKGAKSQVKVQQYQSIRQLLSVQLGAVEAYIDLVRAKEVLKVRQENLSAIEKRKSDSKRRFELGAGTKTDIVQAEARTERAEAEIINAKRDISQAMAAIYEATGSFPDGELDFPVKPVMPIDLMTAWDTARTQNPDILSSETQIDIAHFNVKSIQNTFEPEFRLVGDIGAERDTAFNGFEREDASVRVRMSVPLFAGGASGARKKQSLYARNRIYYQRNQTMNQVLENLRSAWAEYEASQELVGVNENLADVARSAAESVKKEADAGFRPNIDILDSQQEFLEARLALTQSRYDEVLSAYIVRAILGDIGISNLIHCDMARPDFKDKPGEPFLEGGLLRGVRIEVPEKSERPRRGPPGK